ncbi:hypothetical protein BJ742DRAFT_774818 [Cladochytrium replicatum]|nr:hypothetical protein BJ742DRAFT_774818 [Cladochytrium replicatum]
MRDGRGDIGGSGLSENTAEDTAEEQRTFEFRDPLELLNMHMDSLHRSTDGAPASHPFYEYHHDKALTHKDTKHRAQALRERRVLFLLSSRCIVPIRIKMFTLLLPPNSLQAGCRKSPETAPPNDLVFGSSLRSQHVSRSWASAQAANDHAASGNPGLSLTAANLSGRSSASSDSLVLFGTAQRVSTPREMSNTSGCEG